MIGLLWLALIVGFADPAAAHVPIHCPSGPKNANASTKSKAFIIYDIPPRDSTFDHTREARPKS